MSTIKSALKLYEASGEDSALKRAKYSLLNIINSQIQELAALHKNLLLEAYEDLGAGISYNPDERDKPKRYEYLTKEEEATKTCSSFEVSLIRAAEEVEGTYDFAAEIRQAKIAEKERNMREFEERVRRLKERQAEFQRK